MNRPPVTLYVQPEITHPDQLKNQFLGITQYGSSTHALSILVLRKLGLEKSVNLRPLGGTPAVQAAFEQKIIAGMLTTIKPKIAARPLLNAADLDIPYPMSIIAVNTSFLQSNRETLERLLRAYVEGVAMMVHDKDRAVKILAKYLRRTDPVFSTRPIHWCEPIRSVLLDSIRAPFQHFWNLSIPRESMPMPSRPKSSITALSISSSKRNLSRNYTAKKFARSGIARLYVGARRSTTQ